MPPEKLWKRWRSSHEPRELADWSGRLESMKQCRTAAELLARHGAPAHKHQEPAMEIWHYPLGITDGKLYSIHVAIPDDSTPMAYMHVEPSAEQDATQDRPT